MKKVISGLLVGMLVSTSAMAWGEREQGILAGAAGLWFIQQMNKNGQPHNPPVIVYQQPPVYNSPAPYVSPPLYDTPKPQQYCESTAVVDRFGGHRTVQYCYWK
jgi:hypothetical protein